MDISGNTILITGGNSGIGLGLAKAFHAAGNKVIIAGRRAEPLAEIADAHPGMSWLLVDMADAHSIGALAHEVLRTHPDFNVIVNNAGIMRPEILLSDPIDLAASEEQVAVNLLGPIRLSAALLPHLRQQPRAALINVTSGLAFVPMAMVPTYCATKAAVHSYTQSLRQQLAGSSVQVIEIAPPAVATNLMPHDENGPQAMPLHDFIDATMQILRDNPDAHEILVDKVKPLRNAEATGQFSALFAMINGA